MRFAGLLIIAIMLVREPLAAQIVQEQATEIEQVDEQIRAQYWKWIVVLGTVGILEALPGESLTQELWHSVIALRIALAAFVVAAIGHLFFGWWK